MSGHRTPAAGRTSLLRRLVPHPLLMLAIALGWLMLVNDFSLGSLLFGLLLGLVVAKITAAFWPQRARVRRPLKRSEEHTSELQSLMRISYAVFCLKKKNT